MSFFPVGFDPRADVVGMLNLVEIDTPDGPFGFMVGIDGRFVSTDARVWWGSTLISGGDLEMSIGGVAPSGSLTLSFIEDPDAGDLVGEIRALGRDYIADRAVTFYLQPILSMAEFVAPTLAPVPVAVRRATGIGFQAAGPMQRSISLAFEGPFAGRNTARGWKYTTTDHARLTGAANPSLEFAPSDLEQDEKLFG